MPSLERSGYRAWFFQRKDNTLALLRGEESTAVKSRWL